MSAVSAAAAFAPFASLARGTHSRTRKYRSTVLRGAGAGAPEHSATREKKTTPPLAAGVVASPSDDATLPAAKPSPPPSRRETIASALSFAALCFVAQPPQAAAGVTGDALPTVLVVGATGQTGRLVVDELRKRGGADVVAAVRSPDKAKKMGLDAGGVTLLPGFDVTANATALAAGMRGADVVIVCTGFVPGNPFKMGAAAHAVDNEGVVHIVDAAKAAGVRRVVLVSSILTDGRTMGATDSPGFKITNAFGGVLDEKLVGEKYLQASGLEYTIVRPAGLRSDPPKTTLILTPGNVMASGEVSRELVADVMVEAAFAPRAANKVVEIAEEGTFAPGYTPEGVERYLVGGDRTKWF